MKLLGIVLLILGVIVASSAGIQLGEAEYQATVADGRVALADAPDAEAAPVAAETRLDDWMGVAGWQFLGGLVLLTVGAFVGRIAINRDGEAETTADGRDFSSLLAALEAAVAEMLARQDDETPEQTCGRIENAQEALVQPMIDARGVLQRHFGLGGGALVLGPLSGSERQLNRAWSALVDGHVPEGRRSLEAATVQVALAREALEELHKESDPGRPPV